MIHARKDYDRFQDPAVDNPSLLGAGCSAIAEDEPVFLIRAKDLLFVPMLAAYINLAAEHPDVKSDLIYAILKHRTLAREWQRKNGVKVPDMPNE